MTIFSAGVLDPLGSTFPAPSPFLPLQAFRGPFILPKGVEGCTAAPRGAFTAWKTQAHPSPPCGFYPFLPPDYELLECSNLLEAPGRGNILLHE